MRIFFTIMGLLGLFLIGLSSFEIHTVRECRFGANEARNALADLNRKELSNWMGGVERELSSNEKAEQKLDSCLNGMNTLEMGWLVIVSVGATLFIVGVRGVIVFGKRKLVSPVQT